MNIKQHIYTRDMVERLILKDLVEQGYEIVGEDGNLDFIVEAYKRNNPNVMTLEIRFTGAHIDTIE